MNHYDEQGIPAWVLDEFYQLIPNLYPEENAVRVLLEQWMRWPVGAQTPWNGQPAAQAWANIRQRIGQGAEHTGEGHRGVYYAVLRYFPHNPRLAELRAYFESVQPQPGLAAYQDPHRYGPPPSGYQVPFSSAPQGPSGPPAPAPPGLNAQRREQPPQQPPSPRPQPRPQPETATGESRPYVIIRGTWDYEQALAVVHRLDPGAALVLVGQAQLVAAIDPTLTEEVLRVHLQASFGDTVAVEVRWLATAPHAFAKIVGIGPDESEFELSNVPSTASFADVANAVMNYYQSEGVAPARDHPSVTHVRRNWFRRAVNNTSTELGAADVRDGDEVVVHPQSTAGSASTIWTEAVMRVRAEVLSFAKSSGGRFTVQSMDNPDFPTRYHLQITEPGFAPPAGPGAPPQPVETHRLEIWLDSQFPMVAPRVSWRSPIFHPNVLPLDAEKGPPGGVCLGALADAYRPDLDLGEVCQMLVDIAGYRNYELLLPDQGGQGFVNVAAAQWAASEDGQDAIAARGGMRWGSDPGFDPPDRPPAVTPLTVTRVSDFPQGIPGDDNDDW